MLSHLLEAFSSCNTRRKRFLRIVRGPGIGFASVRSLLILPNIAPLWRIWPISALPAETTLVTASPQRCFLVAQQATTGTFRLGNWTFSSLRAQRRSISRGKKKLALSTCRSAILTNFLHYNPRPQQTLRTFFDTMKIGGCQVVIKCGGVAMREHRPDVNENGSEITCYLASQPGKVSAPIQCHTNMNLMRITIPQEFYIEYSRDLDYGPPNTELSVDVYFGGVFDGPGWIAPDPSPRAKKVVGEIMGSRQGDKIHTYAFSKPEIIGSPSNILARHPVTDCLDGETPSTIDPDRVGEIKVVLGFIESRGTEVKPNRRLSNFGPAKVNEKDKKPGAHCAGPM